MGDLFHWVDLTVFFVALTAVMAVGLLAARGESESSGARTGHGVLRLVRGGGDCLVADSRAAGVSAKRCRRSR